MRWLDSLIAILPWRKRKKNDSVEYNEPFSATALILITDDLAAPPVLKEAVAPVVHNAPPIKRKKKVKAIPGRELKFDKLLKHVSSRYGARVAAEWTQTVLKHQRNINISLLETALATNNQKAIERIVGITQLQESLRGSMTIALSGIAGDAGKQAEVLMRKNGIGVTFSAVHPNVVAYARERAAEMVVGIPAQTRQVIAEVVARGAQGLLTIDDQAKVIKELVGLPPNWAKAPARLAKEIRAGKVSAATSRRLSATAKAQIRSRIKNGTVSREFISDMQTQYTRSLINLRARTIARTETLRAVNYGVHQNWEQAVAQGVLPATVRKIWLVTHDDRLSPEHAMIPGLNRNGRLLKDRFITPDGPCMYPPSRPNCRCSIALKFPNGAIKRMSPTGGRGVRKRKAAARG